MKDNATATSTVVYGETSSGGWRLRILGVNGCRQAIQHRRFVSIEVSREDSNMLKGVDVDPKQLVLLIDAIKKACAAETR